MGIEPTAFGRVYKATANCATRPFFMISWRNYFIKNQQLLRHGCVIFGFKILKLVCVCLTNVFDTGNCNSTWPLWLITAHVLSLCRHKLNIKYNLRVQTNALHQVFISDAASYARRRWPSEWPTHCLRPRSLLVILEYPCWGLASRSNSHIIMLPWCFAGYFVPLGICDILKGTTSAAFLFLRRLSWDFFNVNLTHLNSFNWFYRWFQVPTLFLFIIKINHTEEKKCS